MSKGWREVVEQVGWINSCGGRWREGDKLACTQTRGFTSHWPIRVDDGGVHGSCSYFLWALLMVVG